jgi:hypothetical protein
MRRAIRSHEVEQQRKRVCADEFDYRVTKGAKIRQYFDQPISYGRFFDVRKKKKGRGNKSSDYYRSLYLPATGLFAIVSGSDNNSCKT